MWLPETERHTPFDTEKEDKFKFYSSAKSYLRDNAVYYTKLYNVADAYVAEYVLAWVESTAQATVDAKLCGRHF